MTRQRLRIRDTRDRLDPNPSVTRARHGWIRIEPVARVPYPQSLTSHDSPKSPSFDLSTSRAVITSSSLGARADVSFVRGLTSRARRREATTTLDGLARRVRVSRTSARRETTERIDRAARHGGGLDDAARVSRARARESVASRSRAVASV